MKRGTTEKNPREERQSHREAREREGEEARFIIKPHNKVQ
jgi:hypothetical protein